MIQKQYKQIYGYAILILTLFLLCFLFPYSGDDWAWGSQIGLERLKACFASYNGRYLGNLIVIALTRSNLLKAFAMCLCIGGMIVLLNKITKNQAFGLGIILVCLVFMPVDLLKQAIVWTSGFSNYAVSIFLTLVYVYYIRNLYIQKPQNAYLPTLLLAVLGFGNALILEHLTIYNVVLGIYVIVYTHIKYKKIFMQHMAYLTGAVVGTVIMFSNSAYRNIATGNDSYRTISTNTSMILRIFENFKKIVVQGFLVNAVLLGLLMMVCLILWMENKDKLSGKVKMIGWLSIFMNVLYTIASFLLNITNQLNVYWEQPFILLLLEMAATVLYIISFVVLIVILPFHSSEKIKLLFILLSTGCLMAPLLVVTPVTQRCFFGSYIMLIYFLLELSSNVSDTQKKRLVDFRNVFMTFAIIGTLYLFYIYSTIAKSNHERIIHAIEDSEKAGNGATIEIRQLPYKNYVECSDVEEEPWSTRFKLFYGIHKKIQIKMIPYE